MKNFMDHNFLLETDTAKHLYHDYAAAQPIIDYRSQIGAQDIYEDRRFENITQLWLSSDPGKWRLMRNHGVDERYITGPADDREKFQKLAETLPYAAGNPLYHLCHMELKQYFGYEGVLNGETAQQVWDLCEQKLKEPDMGVRGLLQKGNVAFIGTVDDPCSDLSWHKKLAEDESFPVQVVPGFEPKVALHLDHPNFRDYIKQLSEVSGISITSLPYMCRALTLRMEYFHTHGCRVASFELDNVEYREITEDQATAALKKVLKGNRPTQEEVEGWKSLLLYHCAWECHKHGWAMQIFFGCEHNPNSRALNRRGIRVGFDSIAAGGNWQTVYKLLDSLEKLGQLPKTILCSLNPTDNAWLDTLVGAFQGPIVPGKIQHGAAWWYNNSKHGIVEHLESLAGLSVLGDFIGAFTDSVQPASQHEYFRRVLCNVLGNWVENGEYPNDDKALKELVEGICSGNAQRYFKV